MEILDKDEQMLASSQGSDFSNKPDSIESILSNVMSLPNGSEDIVSVQASITKFGLDTEGCISATCPKCHRKFKLKDRWNCKCVSLECGHEDWDYASWDLRFGVPMTISDTSGSWKNLYLNDPLASQFILTAPETFLRMDDATSYKARLRIIFSKVSMQIKVSKLDRSSLACKIMKINPAE